ncbi:hypothetical protein [Mucilaginibacter sp. dw_454]|uniref:hypothetical protein n=1 Tax=Mucilaginibacter sp. dw_454 TaxID=2720079 RepID=UPI001BD50A9C|nr:hypothetical protein [Mucilaginibacter sp. dw_454]
MENALQTSRPETLMSELSNWNQQENKFGALFGQEALKDREFLKMKLENYDQLYYKYNGKAQTPDEKAMMTMLRFQRRKMERSLYPGLLRRILHRGRARLRAMWTGNRENVTINREQANRQAVNLPPLGRDTKPEQQQQQQATVRQMTPVSKYAHQNNRQKNNRSKKHRKGRSI